MELVRVPTLTQDVPYAYAAVSPGGTVYAAGACPLDETGAVVAPGDAMLGYPEQLVEVEAVAVRRA